MPPNVVHVTHVSPSEHPAFYASSDWTLNITRGAMARMGDCPSGRLFEAAACGAAIVSDEWTGLDEFFTPGVELAVAATTDDVLARLAMPADRRRALGEAARERVVAEHTARHRAVELERLLGGRRPAVTAAAAAR
jgi:spore maturation protein CgeB